MDIIEAILNNVASQGLMLLPFIIGFVELLKQTIIPEAHRKKITPVVSVLLGVLGVFAVEYGGIIAQQVFTGIILGLIACGMWTGGKAVLQKAAGKVNGTSGGQAGSVRLKAMAMLLISVLLIVSLAGCTTMVNGKKALDPIKSRDVLFKVKDTGITVFAVADETCTMGLLDQLECDKISGIYEDFKKAYIIAADSLGDAVENASVGDAAKHKSQVLSLFLSLTKLATEFGLLDDKPELKAQVDALVRQINSSSQDKGGQ